METACVDGHSRLSVVVVIDPSHIRTHLYLYDKGKGVCVRDVCAIYDNNISPSLLMIIIKIIILYFIQIRHTDAFPPTGTLLVATKLYYKARSDARTSIDPDMSIHACTTTHFILILCVKPCLHNYYDLYVLLGYYIIGYLLR